MKGDTPINLLNIEQMTEDQFLAHITGIRERRERPIKEYREMLALKEQARKEGLEKKYEQQMRIFKNEFDRLNKTIDKVEDRWSKLRALRLEIDE